MKILRHTQYPHRFDAQGKRLTYPCSGLMQVVKLDCGFVAVRCNVCEQAYKFTYISGGKPL